MQSSTVKLAISDMHRLVRKIQFFHTVLRVMDCYGACPQGRCLTEGHTTLHALHAWLKQATPSDNHANTLWQHPIGRMPLLWDFKTDQQVAHLENLLLYYKNSSEKCGGKWAVKLQNVSFLAWQCLAFTGCEEFPKVRKVARLQLANEERATLSKHNAARTHCGHGDEEWEACKRWIPWTRNCNFV